MKKSSKALLAAFPAALFVLASIPAGATETPTVAAPALQELEEVISYAAQLDARIFDREQRFYARYNQVNEADDLDVTCDFLWKDELWQGISAMRGKRGCVPAFYAVAQRSLYSYTPFTTDSVGFSGVLGVGVHPGRCTTERFGAPSRVVASSLEYGNVHDSLSFTPSYAACAPSWVPANSPDPGLAWQGRQDEFKANLMRVISGDVELQALAADLNALIDEGKASRERVTDARAEKWLQVRCVLPPGPRGSSRAGCGR